MEADLPNSPDAPQLRRWWISAWLFVVLLLIAHTAIRCLLFKNLDIDEAEQLVLIQHLSLGYSAQPPLYSWLVWGVAQIVGANVLALALVKALLLLAFYFQMALLSRWLLPDRRAVLAFLVPLLLPLFAWEALRMSHTPLLCVLCLATMLSLFRLQRVPSWGNYLLLGCCFGLGMLTKYNYSLLAASSLLACLMFPQYRRRILHSRFLVSLLLGGLILLPHACWAWGAAAEIAAYFQELMGDNDTLVASWASLRRVGNFCVTLLATGSIPVGLILLLAWRKGWQWKSSTSDSMKLLVLTVVIGLSLYLIILLMGRMQHFRGHWLAPFLLFIPICLLGRLPAISDIRQRARLYVGVVVAMSLTILAVRGSTFLFDYDQGKFQTRDYLFADLAETLAAQGLHPDEVISGDIHSAGYTRIYLGGPPVQCSTILNRTPERTSTAVTLVVWDATLSDGCSKEAPSAFQAWFKAHVPENMMQHIVTSPRKFDTRTKRLGYCVLMPKVEYSTLKPAMQDTPK